MKPSDWYIAGLVCVSIILVITILAALSAAIHNNAARITTIENVIREMQF